MPKGAKLMKDALRDVVSDVLFYAESTHRDKILNSVALQINAFHLAFATKFPESAENLHILAHSLGGVVAFDLLCAHNSDSCQIPKLACNPKNLFICGSPLGLFLSIRGGEEVSETTDTTSHIIADKVRIKAISRSGYLGTTRCRNILHPMDVLAYRIEPLLFDCPSSPFESPSGQQSSEWMHQPRDIPYHKGRLHTHKRFKNIGKMLSKSLSFRSGEGEADCKEGVKQQGSGFRQGLRGIFRRGLRRGETGDTADTSLQGEEALLKAAESGDWCKSELESAVEQIEDTYEEPHQNGPETSPQGEAEWQMRKATTEEASGRPRIDFQLQRSAAESMSDFITTIRSHRSPCALHFLPLQCLLQGTSSFVRVAESFEPMTGRIGTAKISSYLFCIARYTGEKTQKKILQARTARLRHRHARRAVPRTQAKWMTMTRAMTATTARFHRRTIFSVSKCRYGNERGTGRPGANEAQVSWSVGSRHLRRLSDPVCNAHA